MCGILGIALSMIEIRCLVSALKATKIRLVGRQFVGDGLTHLIAPEAS